MKWAGKTNSGFGAACLPLVLLYGVSQARVHSRTEQSVLQQQLADLYTLSYADPDAFALVISKMKNTHCESSIEWATGICHCVNLFTDLESAREDSIKNLNKEF